MARRRHQLPGPGRPARAPRAAARRARRSVYAALPPEQELLVEYKLFEPGVLRHRPRRLGHRRCWSASGSASARRCWSTSATTPRARTSSRSSRCCSDEGRLGGFHFNNRKYADDDLIVGSVNPFELFLIFCELRRAAASCRGLTIDQSHNVEAKVEAMVLSVVNLQEAYAKALLVDRAALRAAQEAGDVLGGHEVLLDAYRTDVRPLLRAGARSARAPPRIRSPSTARPATPSGRRARRQRARDRGSRGAATGSLRRCASPSSSPA